MKPDEFFEGQFPLFIEGDEWTNLDKLLGGH
jgi:hypothetical protein